MEKDNKILLGAVLIMLVAMISFNFDSITGKAAGSGSGVSVSADPSRLHFSYEDLEIGTRIVTVNVRVKDGYLDNSDDEGLELYRASGERIGGKGASLCGTKSRCGKDDIKTIAYKFSSELEEGNYYFQVTTKPGFNKNRETFKSNLVRVSYYKQPKV